MPFQRPFHYRRTTWRGRDACVLGNGKVRLTTVLGGGHVAELRFEGDPRSPAVNPLWTPPWRTIDPQDYRESRHRHRFGTVTEGKLLSGIAGHSLCLDYFGLPSPEEARQGLSLHGEAPSSRWRRPRASATAEMLTFESAVHLPAAGLDFRRAIRMCPDEPVVHFTETVSNVRNADHFFHWTQHVTLGPPFLAAGETTTFLPGTKALTFPDGYDEGKALLASNREFDWPEAPLAEGGTTDLTRSLIKAGRGFVVAVLLGRDRDLAFVAAMNRRLRLLVAYCFRRADFPWVAIWEENRAIAAPPWKARTEARGLEFGTTPLPVARRDAFLAPALFGESTMTVVPARGRRTVRYLAVLTEVPKGFGGVRDITRSGDALRIVDELGRSVVVPASGLDSAFGPPCDETTVN